MRENCTFRLSGGRSRALQWPPPPTRHRGSWVMLGEGRGLSSRPTQDVVRDLEIGQPSNSEKCSETADGVTRESEGRSRLSLLCPVRQDRPCGYSGSCLRQCRSNKGAPGVDGQDFTDI